MSLPLHWKLPALARDFVWFLGLSKETLFIWHILTVNGIPESVRGVLGWLLWSLFGSLSISSQPFIWSQAVFVLYLHLWHSSHYSFVIITVTVRSGAHSAWLLSAPLQRPVSGSCYCGFMSRRLIHAPSLAVQQSTGFFTIEQFRFVYSAREKNLDCLLLQCQPMVGQACVVLTFKKQSGSQ